MARILLDASGGGRTLDRRSHEVPGLGKATVGMKLAFSQEAAAKSMRLSSWLPVLLIAGVFVLYAWNSSTSEPPQNWGVDYARARASAAAQNKNILVAFYLPGCPPCKLMDRTVLHEDRVIQAQENYISVRVDAGVETDLAARLGVYGTPTYVVLDPQENVLRRIEGVQSTEAFLEFLSAEKPRPTPPPAASGPTSAITPRLRDRTALRLPSVSS